jgi:1-acyl-sn-glycerol-3-phosphate acyltransferase
VRPFAPSSACGYGCLPRPGTVPRAPFPRQVARLLALVLVLLAGIAVALVTPLLTTAGRARTKRGWFRALMHASGVRLVVRGDARATVGDSRGTLVAANHVSWLDIPAVLATEPMCVVAKSEVGRWPVLGLLAARGGTLFIDRNRLSRLPGTVADIAAVLRSGQSVLVFPEGSTWCGRTLGRFYTATFQSAIDAEAPVRPVAIRYLLADGTPTTIAAFVGDDTLIASVLRVVATRGLVVELEIGPVADARGAARKSMALVTATVIRGANKLAQPHLV